MADYPLGSLGMQMRAHWKRHRPKMYAGLDKSGHLAESVHAAPRSGRRTLWTGWTRGCRTIRRGSWRGRSGRSSRARNHESSEGAARSDRGSTEQRVARLELLAREGLASLR